MNFCLFIQWVKTVKIWNQATALLCQIQNQALKILIPNKIYKKYHPYQIKGFIFYFIFTFERVVQNETNDRSNYEYLENKANRI